MRKILFVLGFLVLGIICFADTENVSGYEKSYALCIGIDGYKNYPQLNYAVDDAVEMRGLFLTLGFDDVKVLLDKDATEKNILKAISWVAKTAKKNDRVVIYYSGHGSTDKSDRGDLGYIIPYDFPANGSNYLNAISVNKIKEASKLIKAKHVLYLMDSCYSGAGLVGIKGNEEFVSESTKLPVVYMITAGKEGEESIEADGHGLFTSYLLKAFTGEADYDKNSILTASEIGRYLKIRVSNKAKEEYNKDQNPQGGRLDGTGEIIFDLTDKSKQIKSGTRISMKNVESNLEILEDKTEKKEESVSSPQNTNIVNVNVNINGTDLEILKKESKTSPEKKEPTIKKDINPISISLSASAGAGFGANKLIALKGYPEQDYIGFDGEVSIKLNQNIRVGGGICKNRLLLGDYTKDEINIYFGKTGYCFYGDGINNGYALEVKAGTVPEKKGFMYGAVEITTINTADNLLGAKIGFAFELLKTSEYRIDEITAGEILASVFTFRAGVNIY